MECDGRKGCQRDVLIIEIRALLQFLELSQEHGWDFFACSQISRFIFLSESYKNGVEMHFECDFAPFRIQTLIQSHPCKKLWHADGQKMLLT